MAATEGTLRLHLHEPGSLVREAKYLHQHTGRIIMSALVAVDPDRTDQRLRISPTL
jgi:hypothetical protein